MVPATFEGFVAIIKNLQYNFPKTRGGSKAIWNFSEKTSVLVGSSVPNVRKILMLGRSLRWHLESRGSVTVALTWARTLVFPSVTWSQKLGDQLYDHYLTGAPI